MFVPALVPSTAHLRAHDHVRELPAAPLLFRNCVVLVVVTVTLGLPASSGFTTKLLAVASTLVTVPPTVTVPPPRRH